MREEIIQVSEDMNKDRFMNRKEKIKDNKKIREKKTKVIISCFYDSKNEDLPVGFSWAKTLSTEFDHKYKITILLHGECLKYGLNSETYKSKYDKSNPYKKFLTNLSKEFKVKIVICKLCLHEDNFNDEQLLKFINPINFSVDYIIQSELKKKIVIYDAQLPLSHSSK